MPVPRESMPGEQALPVEPSCPAEFKCISAFAPKEPPVDRQDLAPSAPYSTQRVVHYRVSCI